MKKSKDKVSLEGKEKKRWFWASVGTGMAIIGVITILCIAAGSLNDYGMKKNNGETEAAKIGSAEMLSKDQAEKDESKTDQNVQDEISADTVPLAAEDASEEGDTSDAIQITVSAAGDCTLGTDENFDYDTSLNAFMDTQGAAYFMENVKPIFEADDLSIVNLEGTFTTSEQRDDKQFAFKADPSYAQILTEGDIEAVNLANNHSKDYGNQSYEDTIKAVEDAGITSFGYERTAVMDIKGTKVGLVGIYVLKDGMAREEQLKSNIAAVKEQGAALVIVSFHWGEEKVTSPNDTQKSLAHIAIDNGADLVIGHHPHVLQGIEKYKGKNIAYSLGNFCFGGNKNPSDKDSMIFQQTFSIEDGKVVEDDVTTIIPCSISSKSNTNDYRPTPSEGAEKERIQEKINQLSSEITQ